MTCRACSLSRQVAFNLLLAADLALNAALLGDPRESVSHRTARARAAGSRAATRFCAFLTWCSNALGFRQSDHCAWALDSDAQTGPEIWHWSGPVPARPTKPLPPPLV